MRPSTTSCTIRSWIVAVILFALCLVMSSIATAQVHGYDPGLGTLPEAQGWPRDGNGAPPEPVVVGGVLMQGPTGLEERQRWSQVSPTAFDFTTGFTLDFDLKVVSSGFVTTGANQYRAGWEIAVEDMLGRDLELAIGENTIAMTNDSHFSISPNTVTVPFVTTGGFHHYRLTASVDTARLYVDGALMLTLPIGVTGISNPARIYPPVTTSMLVFGDITASASSQTELAGLQYSGRPWYGYFPALGTLPEDQGWPRDGNGTPPEPVVWNGILFQGPTGVLERQRWSQLSPIAYDFAAGFTLEFSLHVIDTGFTIIPETNRLRAGWEIACQDMLGRDLEIAIGSHAIALTNDSWFTIGPSTATAVVDSTGGFHSYRLVSFGGLARLYVDGVLRLTLPLGATGINNPARIGDTPPISMLVFGDITQYTTGQTELAGIRYTGDAYANPVHTLTTPSVVSGRIGQTVNMTAQLLRAGDGTPAGGRLLRFAVGTDVVGTGVTGPDGVATMGYTIPEGPGAGPRTVRVFYDAASGFDSATATGTLDVSRGIPGLSLYAASGAVGQTVNLKSLVLCAGKPIVGRTVQFAVDGKPACQGTTDASGAAASYTIPATLAPGMHNVTVSFAGDAAYQAASRTTTALTVKARSALSFYAANGSLGGTTLLKAILVSGSARLSGKSVTFWVAGAPAGSGITDASGVAQASWTIPLTLGAGSHNVTATFDGDATYASTTRTAAVLAVARASTVLSFYGASGSTGQTVALRCILFSGSARVAGKSVAFSVDGVAAGSGTTDANGVATVGYLLPALSTGVHSVTAFFGGDATYAAATRTAAVLTVK